MRTTATGLQPDAGLSLIDKLHLLQMVAEHPSDEVGSLIDEVRQHPRGDASAVFGSIRAFLEARPAAASQ